MEAVAGVAKRLDRDYFVRMGRKGGKKGGKKGGLKGGDARAAKLTPEKRKEIAQKAALAKWRKYYESSKGRKRD